MSTLGNRASDLFSYVSEKFGSAGRAGRRTIILRFRGPYNITYCIACKLNSYGYGLRKQRYCWRCASIFFSKTRS